MKCMKKVIAVLVVAMLSINATMFAAAYSSSGAVSEYQAVATELNQQYGIEIELADDFVPTVSVAEFKQYYEAIGKQQEELRQYIQRRKLQSLIGSFGYKNIDSLNTASEYKTYENQWKSYYHPNEQLYVYVYATYDCYNNPLRITNVTDVTSTVPSFTYTHENSSVSYYDLHRTAAVTVYGRLKIRANEWINNYTSYVEYYAEY